MATTNLTRYIVCVPLDLADGRTGNSISARQRWDDRVSKWSGWAGAKGMTVEFVWEGSHELLHQLNRPEHQGRVQFFFGPRSLDDSWLDARLSEALEAAGPRYTAELNVELAINEHFEALGRTKEFFDDIRSLARSVRERIRGSAFVLMRHPTAALSSRIDAASKACEIALEQFKLLSHDPVRKDPLGPLAESLQEATDRVGDLLSEYRQEQAAVKARREASSTGADAREESDHSYMLRELYSDLSDSCERVTRWRRTVASQLAILTGNAGTGETHLLCDLAKQRLGRGRPTVVLMGQRFLNTTDPWTQALQQLDLAGWAAADFVNALEIVAQRAESKAFFVIDAINEGAGRLLWPTHMLPFLNRLRASPWISVVISICSSYVEDVLPSDGLNAAVKIEHHGFESVEFDATSAFFEHYGIDLPSSPLLAPEFSNPLYLKTLCQGLKASGETRLPKGFHGVVGAFAQYVEGINKKTAGDLDYDARRNLVLAALQDVAANMVDTRRTWLSYDVAERIVNAHLPGREYSRSLFPRLLREGLLIEERAWLGSTQGFIVAIQIGYERLSDYLCVQTLLDRHLTGPDPLAAFKKGGPLDHDSLCDTWSRPGLHEALHILVAEREGDELLDLIPTLSQEHFTPEVFLTSVVWRTPKAVTTRTLAHLRDLLATNTEAVIETLMTLATVPEHPLNIVFTDRLLRGSSMAGRDAWWSIGLHGLWGRQSAVDRLVQWANRLWPHTSLTEEAATHAALTIAWLLTSSNRYLRDQATKALVRVLTWRPALIERLIEDFADVNDVYVAERVFAAAYGATMRTTDATGVCAVADRVHRKVFAAGRPRVHLLLRDYARGIICRARYLACDSGPSRWPNSDPPYLSDWPKIPSESQIDAIVPKWSSDKSKKVSWGQLRIRSSVMSDDFGRYVIGTNSWSTNWLSLRLDEPMWVPLDLRIEHAVGLLTAQEREGWELFRRLAQKVQLERLGRRVSRQTTSTEESEEVTQSAGPAERLLEHVRLSLLNSMSRKKATLLAPLMGAVCSDFPSRMPPRFDLKLVQRYVVARVFELGWTPERFDFFDTHLRERGREASKPERIGKKYQWIAYHEMLAYMADQYQYVAGRATDQVAAAYRGSWQDGVRDIDPSNVMLRTAKDKDDNVSAHAFWAAWGVEEWHEGLAPQKWAKMTSDIPLPAALLFSSDGPSASAWVNLHTFMKWSMPRPAYEDSFRDGRREIWLHADGALVRRRHVDKLSRRNLFARGLQDGGLHEIYLGEVGWSDAAKFFDDPYYSHVGWAGDAAREGVEVIAATQGYTRERSGFDCSIVSETISLRLPTQQLLDMLRASWSGISATYVDEAGCVVAFDPSANVAGPSALLVRQDLLAQLLQNQNLVVVWAVQGEKTDAAGSPNYQLLARRAFHGVFVWDGKTMTGEYSFGDVESFEAED